VFIQNSLPTAEKLKVISFEGRHLFSKHAKAGASGQISVSLLHLGLISFYIRIISELKQHKKSSVASEVNSQGTDFRCTCLTAVDLKTIFRKIAQSR